MTQPGAAPGRRRGRALTVFVALAILSSLAPWPSRSAEARRQPLIKSVWKGDLRKAVQIFRDALAADPTDAEAATNLGIALSRLARRDEAIAAFNTAIRLAPARWLPYASLADLFAGDERRWEKRDEVMALLDEGLARTAGDASAMGLVISAANFERSIGRSARARARLEALDPRELSAEQSKRVIDLVATIRAEEQARALADWPEPEVPAASLAELAQAEQALRAGQARAAVEGARRLAAKHPGWRAPCWLAARGLEALGSFDEAERQLTVLLQLAPSHAEGWRRLGLLLAEHGGSLDAERADAALQQGLALEPGWWDLWLARARLAVRRGRDEDARRMLSRWLRSAGLAACDPEVARAATTAEPSVAKDPRCAVVAAELATVRTALGVREPATNRDGRSRTVDPPSARARALYREAQSWLELGDPVGLAPDLLAQALLESPGFVEAAVSAYTTGGAVPEATVKALWNDGDALLDLARRLRPLVRSRSDGLPTVANRSTTTPPPPPPIWRYVDRAVELGVLEGRFERALLRGETGDSDASLDDLRRYVAAAPRPVHLDEARLLLAAHAPAEARIEPARLLARVQLLSDHPVEAAESLGGRCDDKMSVDQLTALGTVHEWSGELALAADCYREALHRLPGQPAPDGRRPLDDPLRRLAEVGARAPSPLLALLEPDLWRASERGVAVANWALARLLFERGEQEPALGRLDVFLRDGDADDPNLGEARRTRDRFSDERARVARRTAWRRALASLAAAGMVAFVLLALFHGATLPRGLERQPGLFPEVARAIGELRHDVLKHRISVLGLLATGAAPRDEVARVLWEPERASDVIARTYDSLRAAARARGVTLRRLGREPTFGPLVRDLRRAEALTRRDSPSTKEVAALDRRLRELHAERLAALLRLGPRTRVDAERIASWIRDTEAELRLGPIRWSPPVLHLDRLDLDFPVEPQALATIFANLLRNAEAVVAGETAAPLDGDPALPRAEPGVVVRVGEERDDTGRRLLVLQIGDSARAHLTLEAIEARESGRGLAIVRDLVHEWRGHIVIHDGRSGSGPVAKSIAVCFPA